MTALDLNECLEPISPHTCTPFSLLPSYLSRMSQQLPLVEYILLFPWLRAGKSTKSPRLKIRQTVAGSNPGKKSTNFASHGIYIVFKIILTQKNFWSIFMPSWYMIRTFVEGVQLEGNFIVVCMYFSY